MGKKNPKWPTQNRQFLIFFKKNFRAMGINDMQIAYIYIYN